MIWVSFSVVLSYWAVSFPPRLSASFFSRITLGHAIVPSRSAWHHSHFIQSCIHALSQSFPPPPQTPPSSDIVLRHLHPRASGPPLKSPRREGVVKQRQRHKWWWAQSGAVLPAAARRGAKYRQMGAVTPPNTKIVAWEDPAHEIDGNMSLSGTFSWFW